MFYILFAVYFLLSRVFLSCSFAPSLLELQPKICSHNLFRPVCICLFVFLHRNLKQETDWNACKPCTHNHSCAHTYTHTYTCAHVHYRPHYPGPRDLCRNYFLFWPREKGEVVRMKYDVTTAVVFLCALLGPGCYPEFSWVDSATLGPVSQKLFALFTCTSQIPDEFVSFTEL